MSNVSAKDETLDTQAFLPLFERNSIARKVLEKHVSWVRPVSKKLGFRAFESGVYEYSGHAVIKKQPFIKYHPLRRFLRLKAFCI